MFIVIYITDTLSAYWENKIAIYRIGMLMVLPIIPACLKVIGKVLA